MQKGDYNPSFENQWIRPYQRWPKDLKWVIRLDYFYQMDGS